MRQFLYLDVDKVNSIIAQNGKGLIDSITTEQEDAEGKDNKTNKQISLTGDAEAKVWKLAKAEASLNAGIEFEKSITQQITSREIVAKTLHDAAFDYAYEAINPEEVLCGKDTADPGAYIEMKRVFDFIDLDYLEGLFSKSGIIDFLKNTEKDKIEAYAEEQKNTFNREQQRHNEKIYKQQANELRSKIDKQYNDIHNIISTIEKIIPYKRMLLSNDGYLIPLDEKYFRVNSTSLGFMYGGEIKCVGMITNIIGKDTDPKDSSNIFATLQFTVNEALRSILPTNEENLYVISPIAVYYE